VRPRWAHMCAFARQDDNVEFEMTERSAEICEWMPGWGLGEKWNAAGDDVDIESASGVNGRSRPRQFAQAHLDRRAQVDALQRIAVLGAAPVVRLKTESGGADDVCSRILRVSGQRQAASTSRRKSSISMSGSQRFGKVLGLKVGDDPPAPGQRGRGRRHFRESLLAPDVWIQNIDSLGSSWLCRLRCGRNVQKGFEQDLRATILRRYLVGRLPQLSANGCECVVHEPGQAPLESCVGELQLESREVHNVDVSDQDRREGCDQARGLRGYQHFAHHVRDLPQALARKDAVAFAQVKCVFRTHLGTGSGGTWALIPEASGHPFRGTWAPIPEHLGTDSGCIWAAG
jgi:hypothetical protein